MNWLSIVFQNQVIHHLTTHLRWNSNASDFLLIFKNHFGVLIGNHSWMIETNNHSEIAYYNARASVDFVDTELQSGWNLLSQLLTGYNHALQLQGNFRREKPISHYLINIMLLSQLVERNEHIVDKVDNFHSIHLRTNGNKAIQVTKHHCNVFKILKEEC